MNILPKIQNRLDQKANKIGFGLKINGIKNPVISDVRMTIDEILESANSNFIDDKSKEMYKKKARAYYKGAEMFEAWRVIPVINQFGVVTIWID